MDTNTSVTVIVTVLGALLGYLATYVNNVRIESRKNQLTRVDRQLREFYGPLFALNHASATAWNKFRKKYRSGVSYWRSEPPPTPEEESAWRLWMKEVFMPILLRMERVIVEHADLIEERDMDECLLDLVAHVSAYKAVIKSWEAGDYSTHISLVVFPGPALTAYIEPRYYDLKARQAKLLGLRGVERATNPVSARGEHVPWPDEHQLLQSAAAGTSHPGDGQTSSAGATMND
ncbi:MAG TPA: hypothetical protein VEW03_15765 [Longimicrobiaceae bacterium]|nr:hypothetical protein [Longimicrobiaceae bacterium]